MTKFVEDSVAEEKGEKMTITGKVHTHRIGNLEGRRYLVITLPFKTVNKFVKTFTFKIAKKGGEQREQVPTHVNKLRRAMLADEYTPQGYNATLSQTQLESLQFDEENGTAVIQLETNDPLRWVDGGHRLAAINSIYEKAEELWEENDAKSKEEFQEQVGELPMTILVYIDGDSKSDFIRLQEGLRVDPSHLLSIKIAKNDFPEKHAPYMKTAFNVLRKINGLKDHPLHRMIGFDSTRSSKQIGFKSLMTKGGSDLATSMYGGAKIAMHYKKDADWLANINMEVYSELDSHVPQLLEHGKLLCPLPEGTTGGTKMLIGLSNMMAYRAGCLEREPTDEDYKLLVKCVKNTLDVGSSMVSAPNLRNLMHDFATLFFKDIVSGKEPKIAHHQGIPRNLISLLTPSTMGVAKPDDSDEEVEEETLAMPAGKRRGRPAKA